MVMSASGDEPITITCTILRVEPPMLLEHTHAEPGSHHVRPGALGPQVDGPRDSTETRKSDSAVKGRRSHVANSASGTSPAFPRRGGLGEGIVASRTEPSTTRRCCPVRARPQLGAEAPRSAAPKAESKRSHQMTTATKRVRSVPAGTS